MRLESDGRTVELHPTGYQFPDVAGDGSGRDTDANWLVISGRVAVDGLSWSFHDACLMTTEAHDLTSWLRQVVRDGVPTESPWTIEPNLRFSVVERTESRVTLRVSLSQESSPPDSDENVRYGAGYPVDVDVALPDLSSAATEWERELEPFPIR